MPRRCTICSHPQVKKINEAICNSRSYRDIGLQFQLSHSVVGRHIETCLQMEVAALAQTHKIKQQINVYDEFCEQLAFAKQLRSAAQEYLRDAHDPLRLSITPKAHEIEVTYFDHNDMQTLGSVSFPKKKTAQLSVILESMSDEGMMPEKFKVTTIDIRKFALDAINTADTCIDKFAKMGGEYTKEKSNPNDIQASIDRVMQAFLDKGIYPDAETARAAAEGYVQELGGVG